MKNEKSQKTPLRHLDGVFLLNKPLGLSSNQALQKIKYLFKAKKAGHTGSLDPLATGMLPICFGEATKFSQFLLEADKRYYVEIKLGEQTATGDTEGEVIATKPVNVTQEQIERALVKFTGKITQVPSMYSALKYQGQPLYKLARQGIEVPREGREITIFELKLLRFEGTSLCLEVHCSKGTYIRTLAEDLGHELGCGAHVAKLHRIAVGPYTEKEMLSLDEAALLAESEEAALDKRIVPVETLVKDYPVINLTALTTQFVRRGQAVLIPHSPTEGWVQLISSDDSFLGMGVVLDDGRIAPKRLVRVS